MNETAQAIDSQAGQDVLQLDIDTFEIDELSQLDASAALVDISLCSSTCSSSCG